MDDHVTLSELKTRWDATLKATQNAVTDQYEAYRELKSLADKVVSTPIDINDYFPTVERLIHLLNILDPCGKKSIFHFFKTRILPSNIYQVRMLRMECLDLLEHLASFDRWRRKKCRLHLVTAGNHSNIDNPCG